MAGGSSSARSTAPCSRCPASPAPRPPCAAPPPATSCSSATSPIEPAFDQRPRWSCCGSSCPPRWCPRLAVVEALPTRTSGKVDRDALPWPLPTPPSAASPRRSTGRGLARRALARGVGADVARPRTTTSSTSAAAASPPRSWSSRLRARYPEVVVGDVYEHPTVGALAAYLDQLTAAGPPSDRTVPPTPLKTQAGQVVATCCCGPGRAAVAGLGRVGCRAAGRRARLDLAADSRPGGCSPPAGWSS